MTFKFEFSVNEKEPNNEEKSTYYYTKSDEMGTKIFWDEQLTQPFFCGTHKDTQLILDWEKWPYCLECGR